MFGPVFTSEAHLAFYSARTHYNNTAEMTAMIEALSFLGPVAMLPVVRHFILHGASSGTIVHGVSLILWHHCHAFDIVISLWLIHSLHNFAFI